MSLDPSRRDLDLHIRSLRPDLDQSVCDGVREAHSLLRDQGDASASILRIARTIEMKGGVATGDGLLKRIADAHKHELKSGSLFGLINELVDSNIIDSDDARTDLHVIRKKSNPARHGGETRAITGKDAERVLHAVLDLMEWFYCESPGGPKLTSIYGDAFTGPPSLGELVDQLGSKIDGLGSKVDGLALPLPPQFQPESRAAAAALRDRIAAHLNDVGDEVETRLRIDRPLGDRASFIRRHFRGFKAGADETESPDLGPLLVDGKGFILLGEPGSGKTTSFYMFAEEVIEKARAAGPGEEIHVPVIVEARMVADEVKSRRKNDSTLDVARFVNDWIHSRIIEPFEPPGDEETSTAGFRDACRAGGVRPVLMLEGFDELTSPAGLETALTEIVVDQIRGLKDELGLKVVVSSRLAEEGRLGLLGLPAVTFRALGDGEVKQFLDQNFPEIRNSWSEIARIFREKLGSRPLGLFLLCRHIGRVGPAWIEPDDFASLLKDCMDGIIAENRNRVPWDRDGEAQRRCLRRLADLHYSGNTCNDDEVLAVARRSRGTSAREDEVLALAACVKRLLIGARGGNAFFHQDVRDSFLADSIQTYLETGRSDVDRPLEIIYRENVNVPLILDVLKFHRQRASDASIQAAKSRLGRALGRSRWRDAIERVRRALGFPPVAPRPPRSLRERGTPAAALSLLARLHDWTGIDCSRLILQGLLGAGQDFRGLDLAGSVLRDADLRGAILDETDLRGANLDNADLRGASLCRADLRGANLYGARLGQLDPQRPPLPARERQPTDLSEGASLAGSNWFNIRIQHPGYLQLWTARAVPGGRGFLLSTSRGVFWHFATGATIPRPIETDHHTDILGFDIDADRGWLATACRDRTVSLYDLDRVLDPGPREPLRGEELLRCNSEYFTRLRFSNRWLGVVDRAGQVYFLAKEAIAASRLGVEGSGVVARKSKRHRGPVVCLECEETAPDRPDVFFTAGYDGVVLKHTEPRKPGGEWDHEEFVSLGHLKDSSPGKQYTIRALLPWTPGPGRPGGLWIGDERGRLHHHSGRRDARLRTIVKLPRRMIYSIAVHPSKKELVLGLSDGSVRFHDLNVKGGPSVTFRREARLECGDIIRSLLYDESGDFLLIVSWAGLVHLWSTKENRFTLKFDPADQFWLPGDDRDHLRFGRTDEVAKIVGLSRRHLDYLKRLGQA